MIIGFALVFNARRPDEQRPLGGRSDVGEPGGRDPGRDARLHGGGDRFEPRGGGPRPGSHRAECLQGRRRSPSSRSTSRCPFVALSALPVERIDGELTTRLALPPEEGGLCERPDSRGRPEPRDRRGLAARRAGDLRRRARGDDPLHRDERRRDRRVADHVLDGELPAAAGDLPAAPSAAEDALALPRRVRRDRCRSS